jgi:hypothetical protein
VNFELGLTEAGLTLGRDSNGACIARLPVSLDSNQAISSRKTVRQPKRHLGEIGVGHAAHVFRAYVTGLAITIDKGNSNRLQCRRQERLRQLLENPIGP